MCLMSFRLNKHQCPSNRRVEALSMCSRTQCSWCPLEGGSEAGGGALSYSLAGWSAAEPGRQTQRRAGGGRKAASCRRGLPGIKNLTSSAARRTLSVLEGGVKTQQNAFWGDFDADGDSAGKNLSNFPSSQLRLARAVDAQQSKQTDARLEKIDGGALCMAGRTMQLKSTPHLLEIAWFSVFILNSLPSSTKWGPTQADSHTGSKCCRSQTCSGSCTLSNLSNKQQQRSSSPTVPPWHKTRVSDEMRVHGGKESAHPSSDDRLLLSPVPASHPRHDSCRSLQTSDACLLLGCNPVEPAGIKPPMRSGFSCGEHTLVFIKRWQFDASCCNRGGARFKTVWVVSSSRLHSACQTGESWASSLTALQQFYIKCAHFVTPPSNKPAPRCPSFCCSRLTFSHRMFLSRPLRISTYCQNGHCAIDEALQHKTIVRTPQIISPCCLTSS